jgi:D-inositol-3-phosphate glycosyltransferase
MEQDAQIVIVGGEGNSDNDVQKLRRLASDLGIEQRVRFLEAQPQELLPQLYSAADVTVVPSYHESFGLVAVESLACSTPVVATRAGGLMTIVQNDVNGYLVPRCPGFFAERLDAILRNPDIQARLQAEARRSVSHFSWQSVARNVIEAYDDLVDERCSVEMLS